MKILRSRVNKKGKREITVEMDSLDGKLIEVAGHKYYQLGGQVDDVMPGHVLLESKPVYWCPISQEWETP